MLGTIGRGSDPEYENHSLPQSFNNPKEPLRKREHFSNANGPPEGHPCIDQQLVIVRMHDCRVSDLYFEVM